MGDKVMKIDDSQGWNGRHMGQINGQKRSDGRGGGKWKLLSH